MSTHQKKCPVLIVDDQQNWRELLRDILEDEFDVRTASSYKEASQLLREQSFHVVITDQRLEDENPSNEDGLTLLKVLSRITGSTKYIVLTGYPTIDAANRAMGESSGPRAYAYLQKYPEGGKFSETQFKELIRKAVNDVECANNAFVLMPFMQEFDDVFECIKRSLDKIGISCTRADDTSRPGIVIEQIRKGIQTSKIIIADVTRKNPNVYFEMGLAHATPRNVILITQSPDDVSDKIGITRYIRYDKSTWEGAHKFEEELQRAVKEIKGSDETVFDPGNNLRDEENVYIALVPVAFQQITHDKIIQPALRQFHFRRGTPILDIQGTDENIVRKLWNQIESALLVITDLSDYDVDVYYLAGFAYGRGKKQVFMIREGQRIPFDTRAWKVIEYSTDISKVEKTKEKIQKTVQEIMPEIDTLKRPRFRILFLAAEPTDQVRLRLGTEFREIRKEIEKSSQRKRLRLELPELSLRSQDFTGALLRTQAQILHFSGHGSNRGELCFEAEDGSSQRIAPEILADAFAECAHKIKCVILNACYSEGQANAIVRHIDYVIGMRTGISDQAAIKFSIGFYQALGEGRTIEQAFRNGKILAGMENANEYDTPVLLKRRR
ncbi:MAG: hypothetical protein Fur0043_02490 [Anaerolineales bacterium]